jgi:THO complex subunit 1
MGSNTIFCGRILTFLSGVFPLGERSGVNLRGEYGPVWDTVRFSREEEVQDEKAEGRTEVTPEEAMAVDGQPPAVVSKPATETIEKKEGKSMVRILSAGTQHVLDFYNTFWSLQLPFSKPSQFASPQTFGEFQEAVNKVLPVIKEATVKERALTGSRTVMTGAAAANPVKRKREVEAAAEQTSGNEYFFAKLLTSPDLLDLEVCSRSSWFDSDLTPFADSRHPLPKAVPFSTARTTLSPADVHKRGQGVVDLPA